MDTSKFVIIGENIHCTRVFKREGKLVSKRPDGSEAIVYTKGKDTFYMPIPVACQGTADWEAGKVKHCVAAVWQGMNGEAAGKAAGIDYLQTMAKKQEAAGATFLDLNVDEFGGDVAERVRAIQWTAGIVQKVTRAPLGIDSSNTDILEAGLKSCDPARGRPMVNSVSLERAAAIAVAAKYKAAVIASAAGEKDLPANTEQRLENLGRLMPKLDAAGIAKADTYIDPLVFPIATDPGNGKAFLDAVSAVRARYGAAVHVVGGLSNVSFGMPARKLINQVFTWLALEAGADGGIVDPLQMNRKMLDSIQTDTEAFRLARALLTGEDMFGAEFIEAHRAGRLGD